MERTAMSCKVTSFHGGMLMKSGMPPARTNSATIHPMIADRQIAYHRGASASAGSEASDMGRELVSGRAKRALNYSSDFRLRVEEFAAVTPSNCKDVRSLWN